MNIFERFYLARSTVYKFFFDLNIYWGHWVRCCRFGAHLFSDAKDATSFFPVDRTSAPNRMT